MEITTQILFRAYGMCFIKKVISSWLSLLEEVGGVKGRRGGQGWDGRGGGGFSPNWGLLRVKRAKEKPPPTLFLIFNCN